MKRILGLWVVFFYSAGVLQAQFEEVSIKIDGFTCSLCALSVEKSIRTLDFVEDVEMDLNTNMAKITFRNGREVSIFKLAEKVYDSGFSVNRLWAVYTFPELEVRENTLYTIQETNFCFLEIGVKKILGPTRIVFLNKKLTSRKEYARWSRWIKEAEKNQIAVGEVYFITFSE